MIKGQKLLVKKRFTLAMLLILFVGCKPHVSVTQLNGEPLTLVPQFNPLVTEYTIAETLSAENEILVIPELASDMSMKIFSNRYLREGEEALDLQPESVQIKQGRNDISLVLTSRSGEFLPTTYHIKVQRQSVLDNSLEGIGVELDGYSNNLQGAFESTYDSLEDAFNRSNEGRRIGKNVGISASVFVDQASWSGVIGERLVNSGALVKKDDLFGIASITKTFIAALALQMEDEGLVSLNMSVSDILVPCDETNTDSCDYYEEFVPGDRTLEQLLTHHSGLERFITNLDKVTVPLGLIDQNWTAADWVKSRSQSPASASAPGGPDSQGYHYADINYWLAGLMLDLLIKQQNPNQENASIEWAIRKQFLEPLNLHNTFMGTEPYPRLRLTTGHLASQDGVIPNVLDFLDIIEVFLGELYLLSDDDVLRKAGHAGGMLSTAEDIARWGQALLVPVAPGQGSELLSMSSLEKMRSYSMSFDSVRYSNCDLNKYGHVGLYSSYLCVKSEGDDHLVTALLTNQDSSLAGSFTEFYTPIYPGNTEISDTLQQFARSLNCVYEGRMCTQ